MSKLKPTAGHISDPHSEALSDLFSYLESSAEGLSQSEATSRLQAHGPNALPTQKRAGWLLRFFKQFHHLLIYVLIIAAVVTAMIGQWIDSVVILAVVLLNAFIGFIQEGKADAALQAIGNLLSPKTQVLRDRKFVCTDVSSLVLGDVVSISAGDRVPADGRLLAVNGLLVDEAIITGESLPVEKEVGRQAKNTPLIEQVGMVFAGTSVTQGTAMFVVTATGPMTQMGQISEMVSGVKRLTTPLVRQMTIFSRYLTLIILSIAGLIFLAGEWFPHLGGFLSLSDRLMAVVGLAVAAIPEGLPAILTITLAVGVKVMAEKKAIVKHLPAIETLGAVSVICTDKTGTLTCNEMMVRECWAGDRLFQVTGTGYAPTGDIKCLSQSDAQSWSTLRLIARTSGLCNDASLHQRSDAPQIDESLSAVWWVEGDPMEGALLSFVGKVEHASVEDNKQSDQKSLTEGWERIAMVPFDAKHRYMATLDRDPLPNTSGECLSWLHVKGAPETILDLVKDIDVEVWRERIDAMASQGQRVLALAVAGPYICDETLIGAIQSKEFVSQNLSLLGLVGLMDPPRPEVGDAVSACHQAGIDIKMITGDHIKTAVSIAQQIGLPRSDQAIVGSDLDAIPESEWAELVSRTTVFARTNPSHKLGIVQALQAQGLTVAMTGDGVNDAPALKQADAGVAMGRTGSDVAREAADLVLTDDHFASIVAAVSQGRTVYENVKKVIAWTLPTSAGEAMVIIFALLAGWSLPISPVQILWINLITVTTLGVVLAFEPTEEGTMRRPPRLRVEPLVNGALLWHMVVVSALFLVLVFALYGQTMASTGSEQYAQTMALNVLVMLEIFHLFFIRTLYRGQLSWQSFKGTRLVWVAIGVVVIAQSLVTYAPWAQQIFKTQPLSLVDLAVIVMAGFGFLMMLELERKVRNRVMSP